MVGPFLTLEVDPDPDDPTNPERNIVFEDHIFVGVVTPDPTVVATARAMRRPLLVVFHKTATQVVAYEWDTSAGGRSLIRILGLGVPYPSADVYNVSKSTYLALPETLS